MLANNLPAFRGSLSRDHRDERDAKGENRLAFEVKSETETGVPGQERLLSGAFTDEDWERLLSLARAHGFDPERNYEDILRPAPGERSELHIAATQELAVALSETLREEVAFAPEGDEEEELTSWVYDPERGWKQSPVIRIGPRESPDLQVGWVHVRQLGELAESGPISISRTEEPGD